MTHTARYGADLDHAEAAEKRVPGLARRPYHTAPPHTFLSDTDGSTQLVHPALLELSADTGHRQKDHCVDIRHGRLSDHADTPKSLT